MSSPFTVAAPLALALLMGSIFSGCAPETSEEVVAKIDEVEISFDDLLRFKGDMPALLLSKEEGLKELEDYLQTMIDMELLVLEAHSLGLEQDSTFLKSWHKRRDEKLFTEFIAREIQAKIDLPKEILKERWAAHKWSRMLRLAHIRVKTKTEADKLVQALEAGRPFAELAKTHSLNREAAERDGELKPFFGRGNLEQLGLPLDIADAVFELEVGQTSQPHQLLDGYEIFKVIEEKPAPASYYLVFSQGAFMEAFQEERKVLLERLAEEFNVQLDPDGMALLQEKVKANTDSLHLSPQEENKVLLRFDGGNATLAAFDSIYHKVPSLAADTDSSTLGEYINQYLLPEFLIEREIARQDLVNNPEIAAWLTIKKRSMLIDAIRQQEVADQVDLSEKALRRYYQEHLDRFMQKEEIHVLEILVETQEEADKLLDRLRGGEAIETLAPRYSIREGAKEQNGLFHMHPHERRRFGELLDAAMKAELGKLQGPLVISGEESRHAGYSIYKVVDRIPATPKSFEQATTQVRYWLRQREEGQLYKQLCQQLRQKYATKIVLFENHLSAMYAKSSS